MSNHFLLLPKEILKLILTPWYIEYKLVCVDWMLLGQSLRKIKWIKDQLLRSRVSKPFRIDSYKALQLTCYIKEKGVPTPFTIRLYSTNIPLVSEHRLISIPKNGGQELLFYIEFGGVGTELYIKYDTLYLIMSLPKCGLISPHPLFELLLESLN